MVNDYDLGANTPAYVELGDGRAVVVQPGKEGGLYLVDAGHLGTLYDRKQIVPVCGTTDDPCGMDWAGMTVTQPAVATVAGKPIVLVATFVPDQTHPAGLVALAIEDRPEGPAFQVLWRAPDPGSPEALRRFRYWPSRVAITTGPGFDEPHAWVVDFHPGEPGTLLGIRVRDGRIVSRTPLLGQGQRNTLPLVHQGIIYIPSKAVEGEGGWLEAYRLPSW
jgi:hypothetical protein